MEVRLFNWNNTFNLHSLIISRRWKREQQKTDMTYPRSYMVGSLPAPGYMQKMANWQPQPSPAIYSVDNQLRWAHHLDANGQNIYAVIYQSHSS